ncbi:hypothetical protein L1887_06147 [Cichorium endivia]|nr:hypothetical protein L1887_06147 [Cichorium endivia]
MAQDTLQRIREKCMTKSDFSAVTIDYNQNHLFDTSKSFDKNIASYSGLGGLVTRGWLIDVHLPNAKCR